MKISKEEIGHQIIVSIIDDQIKADDIDIHWTRNSFPSSIPSIMSGVDRLLSCTLQTIAILSYFLCFQIEEKCTVSGFGMGVNASKSGCLGTKPSLDMTIHIPVPETQTRSTI